MKYIVLMLPNLPVTWETPIRQTQILVVTSEAIPVQAPTRIGSAHLFRLWPDRAQSPLPLTDRAALDAIGCSGWPWPVRQRATPTLDLQSGCAMHQQIRYQHALFIKFVSDTHQAVLSDV